MRSGLHRHNINSSLALPDCEHTSHGTLTMTQIQDEARTFALCCEQAFYNAHFEVMEKAGYNASLPLYVASGLLTYMEDSGADVSPLGFAVGCMRNELSRCPLADDGMARACASREAAVCLPSWLCRQP